MFSPPDRLASWPRDRAPTAEYPHVRAPPAPQLHEPRPPPGGAVPDATAPHRRPW